MDLQDNAEEAAFRARLRGWLSARLPAPHGPPQQWKPDELRSWSRDLHAAGYAGLNWPAEHGGQGLSPVYQAIFAEESALAGSPGTSAPAYGSTSPLDVTPLIEPSLPALKL